MAKKRKGSRDRVRAKRSKRAKRRGEKRASREAQSQALPPLPDRRALEKTMRDITRLIETGGFDSIEEADAALTGIVLHRDIPEAQATTPLEKVQDLLYDAREASGAERLRLVKQALEISPDCADAYVMLAEETAASLEDAIDILRQGVQAGERALGARPFEEDVGHFWGVVRTRPYMRARYDLAVAFEVTGRHEEAIGHYQELLRLNPNDNQGVRWALLPLLLRLGRDEGAERLLDQYVDDASAMVGYCAVLWMFRQEGDAPRTRDQLREALKWNPHVPDYVLGRRQPPLDIPGYFTPGEESEAWPVCRRLTPAFAATDGACEWLARMVDEGVNQ